MISIIAAMTKDRIIGKGEKVPWHIPEDLRNFKETTLGHAVIMGRNTYESIGRPLPARYNIVVSSKFDIIDKVVTVDNIESAILKGERFSDEVFIIGGARLYEDTIDIADRMYISLIKKNYDGDRFFPEFDDKDWTLNKFLEYEDFDFFVYDKRR